MTAGAKGWASPRPWSDVEAALVRAVNAVAARQPAGQDVAVTLAYVPFSTLRDADGADLSWEVNVELPPAGVVRYELADHPATVLDVLAQLDGDVAVSAPPAVAQELAGRWVGWAPLLRQVAEQVCRLPHEEAGVDVTVRRRLHGGQAPRWIWTVAIPVPGEDWPASEWQAAGPQRVLRQVLEQVDVWTSGRPAGHLLISDEELLAAGEPPGDWS
ncbi:hypothetical protein CLV92_1274 [Kineococcus xinjiangensis]|uniref:Uncharacterized protein n=1 Tax=Kineococcus xinjiangensis TaxID=512762 RepID=A0A2S6IBW3_9ACTN|nr:hypothetical protein CLV92_1274 [Kineococcus xinjiangensis]